MHSVSIIPAGSWNISDEPIVVGTNLTLGPESITTILPTANSTVFMVVGGTAVIDGTLVVDLAGRNSSATYTVMAVVKAGQISGGYKVIKTSNAPKGCGWGEIYADTSRQMLGLFGLDHSDGYVAERSASQR